MDDIRFPPCECVPIPPDYPAVVSMASHIAELKLSRSRHPSAQACEQEEFWDEGETG